MDIKLIEAALTKPGKTKSGLAAAMGQRPGAVSEILSGNREIKAKEIPLIAQYLELYSVPVMGEVGAGALISPEYEQVPPDGLSTVELPFPMPVEMIAFKVVGESMLDRYDDGDVIVVYKEQRRGTDSFIGEEAAVRVAEGHRYLKRILSGPRRGTYTLTSGNAIAIEGVRIVWVGEIYLVLRAGQLRRIEAREARKTRIRSR